MTHDQKHQEILDLFDTGLTLDIDEICYRYQIDRDTLDALLAGET